jgi:uncharacterized protein (DUF433 family)/DNA-binding transcriptional MerR regulator
MTDRLKRERLDCTALDSQGLRDAADWRRGVYASDRAAALSGVPKSTLYYWARNDVWTASLSGGRPKLWTYSDLLALRVIYWLRHDRPEATRSRMTEVRRMLQALDGAGERLGAPGVRILAAPNGQITIETGNVLWSPLVGGHRQVTHDGLLDVLAEFPTNEGTIGPNLVEPRPSLRIIPGKLAGEPHVAGTRIPSRSIAALADDGLATEQIGRLYPDLSQTNIRECLDLERQLQKNAA